MARNHPGPVVITLAIALWAVPVAGQSPTRATEGDTTENPSREAGTLFKEFLEVSVVNLEVFVSDKKGNPVLDLTVKDFEIIEDGSKVKLTNFLAPGEARGPLSLGGRAPVGRTKGRKDSDQETLQEPSISESASLVVLIDKLNSEPHDRERVENDLREFFDSHENRNAQIMIASYDGDVKILQQPTSDWGLVEEALDTAAEPTGLALLRRAERQRVLLEADRVLSRIYAARNAPIEQQGRLASEAKSAMRQLQIQLDSAAEEYHRHARKSLEALGYFVASLGPLPGRKAVVYIGEGLPMRPAEELYFAMEEVFRSGQELTFRSSPGASPQQGPGSGSPSDTGSSGAFGTSSRPSFGLADRADAASGLLRSQRRSLSREVRELIALANSSQVSLYPLKTKGRGLRMADVSGTAGLVSSASVSALRDSNHSETLDFIATDTGGISSHGADTEGLLVQALRDFGEHYSLGYSPAHQGDGNYHKVKVKVKRRGVTVRHRAGYEDKPRDEKLADRTAAELVFDLTDNPHGISIWPLSTTESDEEGQVTVPLEISIPLGTVTLIPQGERHVCTGKVFVAVMSPQGDIEPVRGFAVSFGVTSSDLEPALEETYSSAIQIPTAKGARRIAVGFWDEASGTASFTDAEIEADDPGPET